jgi:Asp-tRNA(Asn)/Glu-tRNA(Gln) amidotransferase A subunit family amidase
LNEISGDIFSTVMYTHIWNTLNMPSGALPITIVREDEQHYESAHNDLITRRLRQTAQGSVGLPVGILVIGQPYEEEKVLSLMKSIEGEVKFEKYRKIRKMA